MKQTGMIRRVFSWLLCMCMVLTLLPAPALAAEDGSGTGQQQTSGQEQAVCRCETRCTAESMNAGCPVCSVDGADLAACIGPEPTPEPAPTPTPEPNTSLVANQAAYADPMPTVVIEAQSIPRVYANGVPLLITGTGDATTIYIDTDGDGVLDTGELSLKGAGIENAPENGISLSDYYIYGGSQGTETVENSKITMTGGTVARIYGSGGSGSQVTTATVKITGGKVTYLYGGGAGSTVGTADITVSGGGVIELCAAQGTAQITTANINVTGTDADQNVDEICVFESAQNQAKVGTANITVSGGEVSQIDKCGSYGNEGATIAAECNNINVTVGGSATVGPTYNGIRISQAENGKGVKSFTIADLGEGADIWIRLTAYADNQVVATGATVGDLERLHLVTENNSSYEKNIYATDRTLELDEHGNVMVTPPKPFPPTVEETIIYANGTPLLITGTSDTQTTIYVDTDGDGVLDDGEPSLASYEPDIAGAPADGADLSRYIIYGGGHNRVIPVGTKITMTGGCARAIYGGGDLDAKDSTTPATVKGAANVTITGGTVTDSVYGGGKGLNLAGVTDGAKVTITGGTVKGDVYGGSINSTVHGTVTVTVGGSAKIGGMGQAGDSTDNGSGIIIKSGNKGKGGVESFKVQSTFDNDAAVYIKLPEDFESGKIVTGYAESDLAHLFIAGPSGADSTFPTPGNDGTITIPKPIKPTVDKDQQIVYGNGAPLGVTKDSWRNTVIFWDKNQNGEQDDGETTLASGRDLSDYTIYGGGTAPVNGGTSVTVTDGTVEAVYGGGKGENGAVTGNTNVIIKGGEIESVYGGSEQADVNGNTNVTLTSGGDIIDVTDVYGGNGTGGAISGSVNVTVGNGTVANVSGSGGGEKVEGGVSITIEGYGTKVTGSVSAQGGCTTTGTATVTVGGMVQVGSASTGGIVINGGSGDTEVTTGVDTIQVGEYGLDDSAKVYLNLPAGYDIGGDGKVITAIANQNCLGALGLNGPGAAGKTLELDSTDTESPYNVKIVKLPEPEVDTMSKDIYAKGNPLIIEAGEDGKTYVYVDANGNDTVDTGTETPLKKSNGDIVDVSNYTIYGGGNKEDITSSTSITMLSGAVDDIYGGGYHGETGDTSVAIKGGTVNYSVYGGGYSSDSTTVSSDVKGSTSVTVESGAKVSFSVYGGGHTGDYAAHNANVTGDTRVIINGGTVGSDVYGGGHAKGAASSANVGGNTSVTVQNNSEVKGKVVGGGHAYSNSNTATAKHTQVTVDKSTVEKDIYGGGFMGDGSPANETVNVDVTYNVTVTIKGESQVNGTVYGGGRATGGEGNHANVGTAQVTVEDSKVKASVYGGGHVYGSKGGSANVQNSFVTVGGSADIGSSGSGDTLGVVINGGTASVTNGVNNFKISTNLSGKVNISVPEGLVIGEGLVVATGAVEGDLEHLALASLGTIDSTWTLKRDNSGNVRIVPPPTPAEGGTLTADSTAEDIKKALGSNVTVTAEADGVKTITLTDNVELKNGLILSGGSWLLDLKGHTLSAKENIKADTVTVGGGSDTAKLTITDSVGGGSIQGSDNSGSGSGKSAVAIQGKGDLTLIGEKAYTLQGGDDSSSGGSGVYAELSEGSTGSFKLENSDVVFRGGSSDANDGSGVSLSGSGLSVAINGGTFDGGDAGSGLSLGKVQITGALKDITASGSAGLSLWDIPGTVTVEGGSFISKRQGAIMVGGCAAGVTVKDVTASGNYGILISDSKVDIKSGAFGGSSHDAGLAVSDDEGTSTVTLTGGTFTGSGENAYAVSVSDEQSGSKTVKDLLASGYAYYQNDAQITDEDTLNGRTLAKNGTVTVKQLTATVTGVTVTPTTATVQKGSNQQFTATVTGANNPDRTVNWTVSGGSAGTSISNTGLLTVAADETATALTVTATSTVDSAKSGTATVTVTDPCTVTFDSQGGSNVDSQTVERGDKAARPADPTREGHTFVGWYTDAACTQLWDFDTNVTEDITLYAKWLVTFPGGSGGTTTYPPTVGSAEHGKVTVSPAWPGKGDKVTVTPAPDEGYRVDKITVTDQSGKPVEVTDNGDGTYAFTQPVGKVTITVDFAPEVADPAETGVALWLNTVDHIAYLHGYTGGSFGPDDGMTRGQAAQMFYNLLLNQDVPAGADFSDVPDGAWYEQAVNTMAALGVMNGVGGSRFEPDRSITRAEFIVTAMRFARLPAAGENSFSDVSESDWFFEQVMGAVRYGWIGGYTDGTFRPYSTIARSEVASIVNRMLGRKADEAYVDSHAADLRAFPDVDKTCWAYYDIAEATNAHDYTKSDRKEDWDGLK